MQCFDYETVKCCIAKNGEDACIQMRLKELIGDIRELSNWANEYAETLPEEDRIKMADAGEYMRILSILIDKSTPEILNEIQI